MTRLVEVITAADPQVRNTPLEQLCAGANLQELLIECEELERFRRSTPNLYERVRTSLFLYAIHRFHLPVQPGLRPGGLLPFLGYEHLLQRRYGEAISVFREAAQEAGPSDALCSGLAAAYRAAGFQTLADQVRRSVRAMRGNQWMFRTGHPADLPLRLRPELLVPQDGLFPILHEATPVRMDLSHSGWSDIFFLGMDYPEGAQVLNISIDLSVREAGGASPPRPPVEAFLRVIDEPVLRLVSVDLGATARIARLEEVFDFARDYLGLLKAAVIAAGIVPPGLEGSGQPLAALLRQLVGPGRGLELVSQVNRIPKGSRLAVSTSLLASLIAVSMRATGQIRQLTGSLGEPDRRLVAARAILGEWLAGSGGGWQDSGGVWPGIKLIQGALATQGDPEFGVSRGRLLPQHHLLGLNEVPASTRQALQDSLILVHGGMAQNVGPLLEMVTERYLLRSSAEWQGRQEAIGILQQVTAALRAGDIQAIGKATHRNFHGPIQAIIPWASNLYTEGLIARVEEEFGGDFWGFWMLGGMAGGGMGFLFSPAAKPRAQERLGSLMTDLKAGLATGVPFAMDPVVYDFSVNEEGTVARMQAGDQALLPAGYYTLILPALLRSEQLTLSSARRRELELFGTACRVRPELAAVIPDLFDRLVPYQPLTGGNGTSLDKQLAEFGFDPVQHEQIRADLRSGRIGLAQNRLPANTQVEDARTNEVVDATHWTPGNPAIAHYEEAGRQALADGEVAVVTLAGGSGSRWTQGSGVVKALNPFCRLGGRYRTFLEVHLAKSRRTSRLAECAVPHLVTTSYLTGGAIEEALAGSRNYGYPGPVLVSPGRGVGLRLVPMARDLRFAWEETPQQLLDEQAQKVRASLRRALIDWAEQAGEGSDYRDNEPLQCLHPVGHWFEVPNLLLNGTLERLLQARPQLRQLMVHNVDTVGADLDPALLGYHLAGQTTLTFEVITRRLEDRGGGLARVDGHLRLIEGLALPHEEVEFSLSYYNTLTNWVDVDRLLCLFGLTRSDLHDRARVAEAVRALAGRMPTYVTLKEVKKRWGRGQEDVFPVAQFEKLWGDMSALPEVGCRFVCIPRVRGQQLKEVSLLDGWLRDGSVGYVERFCDWGE